MADVAALPRPQSAGGNKKRPQSAQPSAQPDHMNWNNGQERSMMRLVRHLEMQPANMKPDQVIVTIEHCTNCELHTITTRHEEGKYSDYALRVQTVIQEAFPFIQVHAKATKNLKIEESPTGPDGSPCWTLGKTVSVMGKWPRELRGNCVPTPRLGAFEVQMAVWQLGNGFPQVHLLHSKLSTCSWPVMSRLIQAVAERLPAKKLKVTVQVYDYEDGTPSEVPAPAEMLLTSAAGARVEKTPLRREGDEQCPMTYVEVPMGCKEVVCAGTETTLENHAPLTAAQEDAGGLRLLRIPIHTIPKVRCIMKVATDGNWDQTLALISATKPVPESTWVAESPITESGECWLLPPPDAEHLACTEVHLRLSVGSGPGAWVRLDPRECHPYGTTNQLVEFPSMMELNFDPVSVTTGEPVTGGQIRLVSINGQKQEREWSDQAEPYYLEPGHYQVVMRAPGYFDRTESFNVRMGQERTIPVRMRAKMPRRVGKEEMEVDDPPEAMMTEWQPSKGNGELDIAVVLEESETLKPGVTNLVRVLGGGGGPSELATYITELASCLSLQIGIVTYKGIPKASLMTEDGDKAKPKKQIDEMKQNCVSMRLPLTNNWAGLKVGMQNVDATGPRDDANIALMEGIKMAVGSMPWRPHASRLAIFVVDVSPIEGHNTLMSQEVNGTAAESSLSFMPEDLAEQAQMLRANGITVTACMVGGGEDGCSGNNIPCDMASARVHQALAAEAGGSLGVCHHKGQGMNVIFTGAADVALHQQVVDDYVLTDPFKVKLTPLLDSTHSTDEFQLKVDMYNMFVAVASQMNEAGMMTRELVFHPDTAVPQAMCLPLKPSHVALALRNQNYKGHISLSPEVVSVLNKYPVAGWDKQV